MATEKTEIRALIAELKKVDESAARLRDTFHAEIAQAHSDCRQSTINLIDYLALRSRNNSQLQKRLARLGLSSLGRCESHTRASLCAVIRILSRLSGQPEPELEAPAIKSLDEGQNFLVRNAKRLFGPAPKSRTTRIMVTLPGEAADDFRLVRDLVEAGMNCARINCAHDDPEVWKKLVGNVRAAARELQHDCRILMDLGGPKLRTGRFAEGPAVISWKVGKDSRGGVIRPARLALCSSPTPTPIPEVDAVIPLEAPLPGNLRKGQLIRFQDIRGKDRSLEVTDTDLDRKIVFAIAVQKAYLEPGTKLIWKEKGRDKSEKVADFAGEPVRIPLKAGDFVVLTDDSQPGCPAVIDEQDGTLLRHAQVACTLPEIFPHLKPGERVKFDDGKIGGVIREIGDGGVLVEITHPLLSPTRLGEDKGINFPDSTFPVSGLVEKDLEDLDTVVSLADMVALSFVKEADDLRRLREELEKRHAADLGIILKIETRRGFENLPHLLLAALSSPRVGVMIARGDLGVECGWERMAELQEEILWLCEAAHVPVIWATQVLESLAKTGLPARGEITDAAMSQRAECAMLNKGPHILETVRMLNEILMRMDRHQFKKTPMLGSLQVSVVKRD